MKPTLKRVCLFTLVAVGLGVVLLVTWLKVFAEPAIVCRLLSAEIVPSHLEHRAIKARLRLELTSAAWFVSCYPYDDNAFQIRPVKDNSIVVFPRPTLRPPPPGGRELQKVTLSKKPRIIDVELSENWVLVLRNDLQKGAMIEFYVRYRSRRHTSNYVLVRSPLQ